MASNTRYFYSCLDRQEWVEGDYSLTPISPSAIESIRVWRNAQMDVLRQSRIISQSEQMGYFNKHIWPEMHLQHPKNILLSFFYKKDLIGYGGLVHISWENKRAEISFLLNTVDATNPNIYEQHFLIYLQLIQKISFIDLNLKRLFTETYANRLHHIQILEKSGMKLEGLLRGHNIINNDFVDSFVHGILRSEYEKQKSIC